MDYRNNGKGANGRPNENRHLNGGASRAYYVTKGPCKRVNTHYSQLWHAAKHGGARARERDISLPRKGLSVACAARSCAFNPDLGIPKRRGSLCPCALVGENVCREADELN